MKVSVTAPAGMHSLDLAEVVAGPDYLIKAEHKPRPLFRKALAMEQLYALVNKAYDRQVQEMLEAIRAYIDEVLAKAGKTFKPSNVDDLQQLVRDYHQAFAAGLVSESLIPEYRRKEFEQRGIMPKQREQMIDTAYNYGRSLIPIKEPHKQTPSPAKLTLNQFKKYGEPELRREERAAVEWSRHRAGTYITAIGDQIATKLGQQVVQVASAQAKAAYVETVQEKVTENIELRRPWRELASELGHATKDWSRDLGRVAATEKQRAMQEGIAAGLQQREKKKPKKIMVAKQPTPGACPDCVRLHLTAGEGSPPRIFTLAELEENGTNVGKKRNAWQAVVGPVHPWCSCILIHVPEGWTFDAAGDLTPEYLERGGYLDGDLKKAMTYGDSVPERGLSIDVSDPRLRAEVQKVVDLTPPQIFDRSVGVTLITVDMPRVQTLLDQHDFAYWTGNEIRIANNLPPEMIAKVLPHEIAHSLNVYLMGTLGSTQAVRDWHDALFKLSAEEGFVSDYAKKLPIENAAEVTRVYIYNRKRLMLVFPRQFALAHRAYRAILRTTASPAAEALGKAMG